jgi:hypothetical protein
MQQFLTARARKRDRLPTIRLQTHGFDIVTTEGGEEVRVPRVRYIKQSEATTVMRRAFEAAGHPRCRRSNAGVARGPGWWVYRSNAGGARGPGWWVYR